MTKQTEDYLELLKEKEELSVRLNNAIELLKFYLYESMADNEFDRDNFNFLKEIEEIPKTNVFYND